VIKDELRDKMIDYMVTLILYQDKKKSENTFRFLIRMLLVSCRRINDTKAKREKERESVCLTQHY